MFTTLLVRSKMLVLAGAAVAGLTLAAGPASAGTHWNFGISLNVPVAPAPVYYSPVVVAPQPVYTAPVVYAPPVQYVPAPVVYVPAAPPVVCAPPVTYVVPPTPFIEFGSRGHSGWERERMDRLARERFEQGRFERR